MAAMSVHRPSRDIIDGFRELLQRDSVTCAVSDCMDGFGGMTGDLHPLFDALRLAGPAVTARTLASDLAAVFKAIDVSEPGDVVVVDAHGSRDTASWGENMTISAQNRGVSGANVAAIAGYGQVNVRVQCAGQAVLPGDIIVADESGVVVVPVDVAADVLERTRRLLDTEHVLQEKLRGGATIGELIDVDRVFASTFDYQSRALKRDD